MFEKDELLYVVVTTIANRLKIPFQFSNYNITIEPYFMLQSSFGKKSGRGSGNFSSNGGSWNLNCL